MRPTPEGVGNWARPRGARPSIRCFNEAHARRRGKWPGILGVPPAGVKASMRPTPEGVGNMRNPLSSSLRMRLQ